MLPDRLKISMQVYRQEFKYINNGVLCTETHLAMEPNHFSFKTFTPVLHPKKTT